MLISSLPCSRVLPVLAGFCACSAGVQSREPVSLDTLYFRSRGVALEGKTRLLAAALSLEEETV